MRGFAGVTVVFYLLFGEKFLKSCSNDVAYAFEFALANKLV
jgi:hypothetical protein